MTKLHTLALLVLLVSAAAAVAQPIKERDVHVSDGDTIVVGGKTYRLVGFDTPETFKAKCVDERMLGVRARKRLVELINGGGLDLTEVRCSCTAPQGSNLCNWGRACGTLTAKGVDVGLVLISEGLARRYTCGKHRCPKRQSWCQ